MCKFADVQMCRCANSLGQLSGRICKFAHLHIDYMIPISTIIGSLGVALLLLAFFLNTFRFTSQQSTLYILLNIIGAALSCYASFLIDFLPFVILEATWCLVAVVALIRMLVK